MKVFLEQMQPVKVKSEKSSLKFAALAWKHGVFCYWLLR